MSGLQSTSERSYTHAIPGYYLADGICRVLTDTSNFTTIVFHWSSLLPPLSLHTDFRYVLRCKCLVIQCIAVPRTIWACWGSYTPSFWSHVLHSQPVASDDQCTE